MAECPHIPGAAPEWCSVCLHGPDLKPSPGAAKAKPFFPKKKADPPRLDHLPVGAGVAAPIGNPYEQQFSGARWERMFVEGVGFRPTPGARKPQTQRMRSREKAPTTDENRALAGPLDQPGGTTALERAAMQEYRRRQIRRGATEAARRKALADKAERNRQRAKARSRRRGEVPPVWAHKQSKRPVIRSQGGAGS